MITHHKDCKGFSHTFGDKQLCDCGEIINEETTKEEWNDLGERLGIEQTQGLEDLAKYGEEYGAIREEE